jgi:O-Antigen ligase
MSLLTNLTKVVAFAWLVIIGTNVAGYYSYTAEIYYQGMIVLAGAVYFMFIFHKDLLRLIVFEDYLLVLLVLVTPIALALLSSNSFERAAYTTPIAVILVFVSTSILALRKDLNDSLIFSTFTILSIGAVLNLYELFVEHNTWSTAPGRSAGLYVNPNISSGALVSYGLATLSARLGRLRAVDLIIMILVLVGVFSTFSRSGILASLVLLSAAILVRARREDSWRVIVAGVGVTIVFILFGAYVFLYMDLSLDAALRIMSLLNSGGIGDYQGGRGYAAENALELVTKDPIFGAGVGTVSQMEEGPHNMFVAMLVDYGAIGLIVYLLVFIRLALTAVRADRTVSGPIWLFLGWLTIFGFASHDLMTQTATIPLMGFALGRAYTIQSRKPINDVK